MIYLANSLAALSILSLVVFIGSVFALFVKSARRIAKWLALAGFVGFFAAGFASLPFFERAAHEAGYSDFASQTRAEGQRPKIPNANALRNSRARRRKREKSAKRPAVKGEDDQATSDPEGNRKLAVTALAVALKPVPTRTQPCNRSPTRWPW